MPTDRLTRKALDVGRAEAREVLKLRATALRRRTAATRGLPAPARAKPAPSVDEARRRAGGGLASAGVLVAEGDPWFDYPLNDVLRLLEDDYAYDVESVAHKGDRVEDMAYGPGQLEELTRGTLSIGADYKTWWANELHPTPRGFQRVTARFAAALAAVR